MQLERKFSQVKLLGACVVALRGKQMLLYERPGELGDLGWALVGRGVMLAMSAILRIGETQAHAAHLLEEGVTSVLNNNSTRMVVGRLGNVLRESCVLIITGAGDVQHGQRRVAITLANASGKVPERRHRRKREAPQRSRERAWSIAATSRKERVKAAHRILLERAPHRRSVPVSQKLVP